MPPPSKNFIQRIKDKALDRIHDRIKREVAPVIEGPDDPELSDVPAPEKVEKGFWKRIKQKSVDKLRDFSPVQRRLLDPRSPLDEPTIKYRIRYAGQNRVLLHMLYNGQWRYVEPWSYRWRGKPDQNGKRSLRFFGGCRLHMNNTHMFNLNKIEGLVVTDIPFIPKYPIEL